jgi:TolB-like protein
MVASYKFGPFHLDTATEVLFRGAEPLALVRRAVALLRALVEQSGMPVSKDALIEAGWPSVTVDESNLTVQIGALRRVLKEVPDGEHRIDTLPRRGYRFVGQVVKEENSSAAASPSGAAPAPALPDKPSIAVLPFVNMSGDPEQDYFADGMAEEIITALSRCSWLFVIARNSSFTYKGKAVDVRQVGRELGVRYVLEGSVRRGGDRLRFTGQLIDAISGGHIWAESGTNTQRRCALPDCRNSTAREALSDARCFGRRRPGLQFSCSRSRACKNLRRATFGLGRALQPEIAMGNRPFWSTTTLYSSLSGGRLTGVVCHAPRSHECLL